MRGHLSEDVQDSSPFGPSVRCNGWRRAAEPLHAVFRVAMPSLHDGRAGVTSSRCGAADRLPSFPLEVGRWRRETRQRGDTHFAWNSRACALSSSWLWKDSPQAHEKCSWSACVLAAFVGFVAGVGSMERMHAGGRRCRFRWTREGFIEPLDQPFGHFEVTLWSRAPRSPTVNTNRALKTGPEDGSRMTDEASVLDRSDVVKIEIEHISGEILLEIKLEVCAADLVGEVAGSKIMWSADGLRVTIPTNFLNIHRDVIARLVQGARGQSPSSGGPER